MAAKSLFSLNAHLEMLSRHGDPLEMLERTVDFEYFRAWLVEGLGYDDGGKGRSSAVRSRRNVQDSDFAGPA